MNYRNIVTDEDLKSFCRAIAQCPTIAFDTEFISEHTYRPILCLIQVAAGDELAVIDPLELKSVKPFWEAIAAPGHVTIVHAGRSELEFCLHDLGKRPTALFDVQIAAGMIGYEYPAGYGTLLARILGEKVKKHETRTDWRRRPLNKKQIDYAIGDVAHLQRLYETIKHELTECNRLSWLEEEMETWQSEVETALSHERWRRVSGNAGLSERELAILRELYHWREAEAQRRDQPAKRILRDDLIVELAKRGSSDPKQIAVVRGMERGDLARRIDTLSASIQRGIDLPDDKCPERIPVEQTPQLSVLGQFLFAALGSVSRKARLAPSLVGTPNDIRDLINFDASKNKVRKPPRLARGWREQFVGRLFEELLGGKVSVRIADPHDDAPLAFDRDLSPDADESTQDPGDGESVVNAGKLPPPRPPRKTRGRSSSHRSKSSAKRNASSANPPKKRKSEG